MLSSAKAASQKIRTACGIKAALNMLMRSVAARHGADRRAMILMAPGWVCTEMGGPDARLAVDESIPGVVSALLGVHANPGCSTWTILAKRFLGRGACSPGGFGRPTAANCRAPNSAKKRPTAYAGGRQGGFPRFPYVLRRPT